MSDIPLGNPHSFKRCCLIYKREDLTHTGFCDKFLVWAVLGGRNIGEVLMEALDCALLGLGTKTGLVIMVSPESFRNLQSVLTSGSLCSELRMVETHTLSYDPK